MNLRFSIFIMNKIFGRVKSFIFFFFFFFFLKWFVGFITFSFFQLLLSISFKQFWKSTGPDVEEENEYEKNPVKSMDFRTAREQLVRVKKLCKYGLYF